MHFSQPGPVHQIGESYRLGMIKRIKHGYEITVRESDGVTILHVYDNGTVEDVSGAPVDKSDVDIAAYHAPDQELKGKIWAWWNGHSSR